MKKILLICRDEDLEHMLKCELKSTGYAVFGAFSGIDAVDAVICGDSGYSSDKPVIYLDEFRGSDSGCVDIVSLIDKINSVTEDRRNESSEAALLTVDNGILLISGKQPELSPRESELFMLLFSNKGSFVSKEAISENVWNGDADDDLIAFYIFSLRKKLARYTERVLIKTKRNKGYGLFL